MRSEGSRLLGEAPGTNREKAARVGVSAASIGYWTSGQRVPRARERVRLKKAFGIPVGAWPAREDESEVVREFLAELAADVLEAAGPSALERVVARMSDRVDGK